MLSVEMLRNCGNKVETFGEKPLIFCKKWLHFQQIVENWIAGIVENFFDLFIFQDIADFFAIRFLKKLLKTMLKLCGKFFPYFLIWSFPPFFQHHVESQVTIS